MFVKRVCKDFISKVTETKKKIFLYGYCTRLIVPLFFLLILGLGLFLNRDYELSWDEPAEWRTGIVSAYYAKKFLTDGESLPRSFAYKAIAGDCYYGTGFQFLLLAAEYFHFGKNVIDIGYSDAKIWQLRHGINFVFCYIGLIALYLSGKLLWRKNIKALIPVILFLLIPRFWAESFYNSKDMIQLSALMIAGYLLLRMLKVPSYWNVVLCAVASAFSASIRLTGGMVGVFCAAAILTMPHMKIKRRIVMLVVWSLTAAAALICLYPISWSNPIEFFFNAVNYMSHHPWGGVIVVWGRSVVASRVPWYYVPSVMIATLPLPFLLLFISGHRRMIKSITVFYRNVFRVRARIILMLFFYISLLAIMFFCRTCYNLWRQFYFLAWPMLLIAADGLDDLWNSERRWKIKLALKIAFSVWVICTVAWMVHVHPFQNMFFNVLAGNPNGRFELDYWHLSEADALRYIAERAKKSGEIATVADSGTNRWVLTALKKDQQKFLRIVPEGDVCRYFICFEPPKWNFENGELPFNTQQLIRAKVVREKYVRSSLFLHPILVYRIWEFFPIEKSSI